MSGQKKTTKPVWDPQKGGEGGREGKRPLESLGDG